MVINWTITATTCVPSLDGLEDVVDSAGWLCVCEQQDAAGNWYMASRSGSCLFTQDPLGVFTARSLVDEATILSWVWVQVDRVATESAVQADVTAQTP